MAPDATETLFDAALRCLRSQDPAEKVVLTRHAAAAFDAGRLEFAAPVAPALPIAEPGRPARPRLVRPRELAQRGLGSAEGRAALVHAVAHIEFNAINLAWDAVYRFRDMPREYYRDWIGIAVDEARHFGWLEDRLAALGHAYGDFDAHNGLWEMAAKTADSCLARMALVPRVLEARGLDVTPGMIARLSAAGDGTTAAILERILVEEVPHVAAGSRWFAWCCDRERRDPATTFRELLVQHLDGGLRGPFNVDARLAAGFSREELAALEQIAA
jgi:uncharacterized ferritin-like protein (DUF455 family)